METVLTTSQEVQIEKIVYGGEGLARTADGIVLVPGALPGERVRVELEPPRRGVRRARLLEILAPSADRVAPPCPFYAPCGGCHHQQLTYARQLEWKQQILAECFERVGKIKLAVSIETVAAEPWEYRNRVRLRTEKRGEAFQVGYRQSASHELCPVDACAISSPALQAAIRALAQGRLAAAFPEGDAEIELFASDGDRALLATIYSEAPAPGVFGDAWLAALPAFQSVCWSQQRRRTEKRADTSGEPGDTVWGAGAITVRAGEFHYRVSHHSFFQTNRFLLESMIHTALGELRGARALDLFAGVGFFTLPLARRFDHVIAVEPHPAAAQDLQANAGVAATQIYAYAQTAEAFLQAKPSRQPWDLILVDPPRHGLSTPARAALAELRARHLVYVSCDPTTLARDLKALDAAYVIQSIHLIDLFPQTYHLETIVHLAAVK